MTWFITCSFTFLHIYLVSSKGCANKPLCLFFTLKCSEPHFLQILHTHHDYGAVLFIVSLNFCHSLQHFYIYFLLIYRNPLSSNEPHCEPVGFYRYRWMVTWTREPSRHQIYHWVYTSKKHVRTLKKLCYIALQVVLVL